MKKISILASPGRRQPGLRSAIGLRSDCDRLRSEAFEISRVWLLGYLRYQLRHLLENKVSQVIGMAMKLLCFTAFGEPRWGHAR